MRGALLARGRPPGPPRIVVGPQGNTALPGAARTAREMRTFQDDKGRGGTGAGPERVLRGESAWYSGDVMRIRPGSSGPRARRRRAAYLLR